MPSPSALPGFEPTQHYQRHARIALTPGSCLGDFEIVRVLGVGGFSIVYLARDKALNRLVALKEYLPSALAVRGEGVQVELRTSSNEETFQQGLQSFIKEARMLARFDHPSLVRVHHFWRANGTAYMAMRYLEGVTLLAARRAMPRPPEETWLRTLLGSLLGAIEALHAESCFHRDISPDNILLLPDNTPVLLDFGAARNIVGDSSEQVTAILKPGFAPIEQYAEATDLRQGPWTDLYALGAVVRNCITNRPPIPSTVRAVDDRLPSLALEVRSLAASFPGLSYSPSFLAAVDWALALRPADRPQSVAQFRQALSLAGSVPIPALRGAQSAAGGDEPPRVATTLGRAADGARGAAAAIAALWAAPTIAKPEPPSALAQTRPDAPDRPPDGAEATRPDARDMAEEPTVAPLLTAARLWRPSRAGLRRAMPWSVAAVLLGAVASVGWRSFEERQVGRDMAVIASSAAAAAERAATPAAFAAPPAEQEAAPIEIYTVQPAHSQPTESPAAAAAPEEEIIEEEAESGAEAVDEPSTTEAATQAEVGPQQPVARRIEAVMERSARPAAPQARTLRNQPAGRGADGGAVQVRRRTASGGGHADGSPREICARQKRYTDYVCMQRQCKKGEFRGHAQCEKLRKTGWWGFIRLPGG